MPASSGTFMHRLTSNADRSRFGPTASSRAFRSEDQSSIYSGEDLRLLVDMPPESMPPVVKPKVKGMHEASRIISLTIVLTGLLFLNRAATAATEVRLDRDFMAGVAEK